MLILLRVVLAASIVGLIVGLIKNRSGLDWARRLLIGSFIAGVLSGAGTFAWPPLSRRFDTSRYVRSIADYLKASTYRLGVHLANKHPGAKAAVILPLRSPYGPPGLGTTAQGWLLDGLREGFDGKITISATFHLKMPEEVLEAFKAKTGRPLSELLVPLEDWFTSAYFDRQIAERAGGCNLIVSLAGFPHDLLDMELLQQTPRPVLAAWYGDDHRPAFGMREAIEAGYVAAVVAPNPRRIRKRDAPKDLAEAFERRYLLLTAENVARITAGRGRAK